METDKIMDLLGKGKLKLSPGYLESIILNKVTLRRLINNNNYQSKPQKDCSRFSGEYYMYNFSLSRQSRSKSSRLASLQYYAISHEDVLFAIPLISTKIHAQLQY